MRLDLWFTAFGGELWANRYLWTFVNVSFLWLRLGTLVMRRLDGCAFQPPAQSGSCSVGDAQVFLRRPFRADPDRPRQSKLDVVSDFFKGQSDAAPDITMSELATVVFERHTIRATPAMLSRHLIHRLNYPYKKIPDRYGKTARTSTCRAIRVDAPAATKDVS